MKNRDLKLKTTLDIGLELKDSTFGGKKITRNILGFNVTMHFKKGVCKISINNITKLNLMTNIENEYRNINFNNFNRLDEEDCIKIEYIIEKVEEKIIENYYSKREIDYYNYIDLESCHSYYLQK